jgi:hypothetical protein
MRSPASPIPMNDRKCDIEPQNYTIIGAFDVDSGKKMKKTGDVNKFLWSDHPS